MLAGTGKWSRLVSQSRFEAQASCVSWTSEAASPHHVFSLVLRMKQLKTSVRGWIGTAMAAEQSQH